MNIILIGFKNCGKTSVGKFIAESCNRQFIDTDRLSEQHYSKKENHLLSTCEIYRHRGEAYFRQLEKSAIHSLDIQDCIIATGGGSVLDTDNVAHFKKLGSCIYLQVRFETLFNRLIKEPLPAFLNAGEPAQHFEKIYNQRKIIYQTMADIAIDTENKSINTIADEIITLMRNA